MKKALSAITAFCVLAFPAVAQNEFAAQSELSERDLAVQEELVEAIRSKYSLSRLQTLLDAGADPNTVVDGRSLLARAAREGNVPAVQLLLERGADPNWANNEGLTAAHQATESYDAGDCLSILRLLAAAGARFDITDSEGVSPLIISLDRWSDTEVFMMILRWEETNSPGFAGVAANRRLYLAAAMARLWDRDLRGEEIKALLAAGADPAAFISGKAVSLRDIREEYVPLLLENGTPVDIQNKDGRTFLMEAASRWRENKLVLYLLEAKADPNIQDSEGRTALMEAQTSGTARLLLDYGADPGAVDHNGRTALHHGYYGNKEQLALLIRAGADIEAPDNEGLTPFLYAAFQGTSQGMSDLLDLGADPNKKSLENEQPRGKPRGIEDFSLKSLRMRGNKSPAPPVRSAPRGGVLNPIRATPLNKTALLLYLKHNILVALPSTVRHLLDLGADPAEKDSSGNSPLLTAFREKPYLDNVREIRDILVSAADKEQVSAAKSAVFAENFPGRFIATVPLLLLLAYIAISIWIREGAYRDDPGSNWMGTINAFITGFAAGAPLAFFTLLPLLGLVAALLVFHIGTVGGLIGGIALAAIPQARNAFKKEPFLYYLPPAAAGIVFTIAAVRIWLG